MTKETLFRIYKILLSISIIVAGCSLMAGSLYVFFSGGDEPYSRQIVADVFAKICAPIYVSLTLIIVGFVLNFFIPFCTKTKPTKQYTYIVNRLLKVKDTNDCLSYKKIRKQTVMTKTVNILIISFCGIVFFMYALNPNNYYLLKENGSFDFNSAMINSMKVFIPCVSVSFISSVITHYISVLLFKRQIELLKSLPNKESTDNAHITNNQTNEKKMFVIKILILILGISCLISGAILGGYNDVLTKAVQICTECIGLG